MSIPVRRLRAAIQAHALSVVVGGVRLDLDGLLKHIGISFSDHLWDRLYLHERHLPQCLPETWILYRLLPGIYFVVKSHSWKRSPYISAMPDWEIKSIALCFLRVRVVKLELAYESGIPQELAQKLILQEAAQVHLPLTYRADYEEARKINAAIFSGLTTNVDSPTGKKEAGTT